MTDRNDTIGFESDPLDAFQDTASAALDLGDFSEARTIQPIAEVEALFVESVNGGIREELRNAVGLGVDILRHPVSYARKPKETVTMVKDAIMALGIPGLLGYNAVKGILAGTVGYSTAKILLRETLGIDIPVENEVTGRLMAAGVVVGTSTTFIVAMGMIATKFGIKKLLKFKP